MDAAKKSSLHDVSKLSEAPDLVWKSVLKDRFFNLDKIRSAYTAVVD